VAVAERSQRLEMRESSVGFETTNLTAVKERRWLSDFVTGAQLLERHNCHILWTKDRACCQTNLKREDNSWDSIKSNAAFDTRGFYLLTVRTLACYDCAWLSLTALSTVTYNLWL
jgi:hypothetical protein